MKLFVRLWVISRFNCTLVVFKVLKDVKRITDEGGVNCTLVVFKGR